MANAPSGPSVRVLALIGAAVVLILAGLSWWYLRGG